MAGAGSGRLRWVVLALVAAVVAAGIYLLSAGDGSPPSSPGRAHDAVEIASWTWKKDRSGSVFAVYGQVRNLTDEDFSQVVLELRTVDEQDAEVSRHPIVILALPAHGQKPFREDVPRTGREARGFLEVREVRR